MTGRQQTEETCSRCGEPVTDFRCWSPSRRAGGFLAGRTPPTSSCLWTSSLVTSFAFYFVFFGFTGHFASTCTGEATHTHTVHTHTHTHTHESGEGSDVCLLYYYYIFAAASTHMCLCVLFHMQISWMRDYYKTNNLKTTTAEIGNGGRTVTCFTVFCLACFSTETWKYSFL